MRLFFVKLGRIGLLQWVICQSLDNAHHFRDRNDHKLVCIVSKHDRTSTQDDASEDRGHELEHCFFLSDLLDADANIGDHEVATFNCAVQALNRGVRQHLELFWTQITLWIVIDFKPVAVWVLLPEKFLIEPFTIKPLK